MKRRFLKLIAIVATALVLLPQGDLLAKTRQKAGLMTVVIDPGHGGKDPGCISRDNKTNEKSITLDISRRLSQKISAMYPEVNVILTRSDDRFVELEDRAKTANNAGANLFISIHVNAQEKGTSANGYSIHCLGQSSRKGNDLFSKNFELCKRENSVMLLEDNYETKYQGFDPSDTESYIFFSLIQNAHLEQSLFFAEDVAAAMGSSPIQTSRGISQDPFWVLWRTAMPAVLIEVGFITNPSDLAAMRTEEGRDGIATNICNAFSAFKTRYDSTVGLTSKPVQEAKPIEAKPEEAKPVEEGVPVEKPAEDTNASSVLYGTQVLVTGKKMSPDDPFFGGMTPVELRVGTLYKYIIGTSPDLVTAKKNMDSIKKKYEDCFLVKIENEKAVAVR